MDDFPKCVPKPGCKPLNEDLVGREIKIKYESTIWRRNGGVFIPNGKKAIFSCDNSETEENDEIVNEFHGVPSISCQNGKWDVLSPNRKPYCVRQSYCKPLSNYLIGNGIKIKYELTISGENGEYLIRNGAKAQFSCNGSETKNNNETVYELKGISSAMCQNGKWHGLSLNQKPNCVVKDSTSMSWVKGRIILNLLKLLVLFIIFICLFITYLSVSCGRKKVKQIKQTEYHLNCYDNNHISNNSNNYLQISTH